MKTNTNRAFVSLVAAAVLLTGVPGASASEAAGKQITIAVVRDGPSEMNEIISQIRPELNHLVGEDYDVAFDTSDDYDAGWDPQRYRQVIETALRNPQVDIIVGIGWLVAQEAARPDLRLTKPFVSATLLDGDLPLLEFEDDKTLKDNLGLVIQAQRTDTEVDVIKRLVSPTRAHVVMSREMVDNTPGIKAVLDAYGAEIDVELVPVLVSTDWRSVLDGLGPDVELMFFQHTPRLSRAERAAFVEAVNERKIPTFSGDGPEDLEIGMLATNRPDTGQQLVRRVALNLSQIIGGSSTDDLPVLLIVDSQLTINGKTAAKIGFGLTFEAKVLGTVLHREALEADADSLDIKDVLAMADTGNIDLSISNQEVVTALRGKQVIRSPLLPQLGVGAQYNNVENPLVGEVFPEQWGQANVRFSQMIFDDEFISDFRSTGREYEAAMFQNQSDRLDVFLGAESAYLTFVQTRLLFAIALKNLRLTEGNLEIAKMRAEIGHSGRDEVYRWTAELNQQRTLVMDIESIMETRRIELNRVLGIDLGKRWRPEPMDEDANWFVQMRDKFGMALESQTNFDRFTEVAVAVALEQSPERKFLIKNIEAENIQLGQRKRSFIVPKVSLDMSYNYNFWQSPDEPALPENVYDFRVVATLPLFQGTQRIYDMQLSESLIIELERKLVLADQLVEQRTRNSLRQLQASLPNLEYSQLAADNARKNFEVVRDQYANGIVNVTDLISAQTASFAADQDALIALYTFLLDSADFQRAISFFPETKSPREIEEFSTHIRDRVDAMDAR
jgi:outer membrane protein TolC/ABC-type uncharacterized transport system substrate-binding protein